MAVTMEEAWAECEFEVFRFRHLRNLAQDMRAALPLEAHRWRLKTVECLTGDRIVAWLVEAGTWTIFFCMGGLAGVVEQLLESPLVRACGIFFWCFHWVRSRWFLGVVPAGHASDSAEALAVGAELLRTKLLRSVAGEGVSVRFEDNSLALYQFHLVSDRLALMSFAKVPEMRLGLLRACAQEMVCVRACVCLPREVFLCASHLRIGSATSNVPPTPLFCALLVCLAEKDVSAASAAGAASAANGRASAHL